MAGLKQWLLGRRDAETNAIPGESVSADLPPQRALELIEDGNRLEDQGELASALARYREAARLAPGWARVHVNVGNALYLMGSVDAAIAAQQLAISLEPGNAPAHYNLGMALNQKGEAESAEAALREALRLRPGMTDARIVLSDALERRGLLDEAEAELRLAIEQDQQSLMAVHNLAVLLHKRERYDDAEDVILGARTRFADPSSLDVDLASLYITTARTQEAERLFRRVMESGSSALQAAGGLLFSLNCRDDVDAEAVFREHVRLGKLFEDGGRNSVSFPNRPESDRLLKIGYVSGDFRRHPVGLFMRPILAHHDPDLFEVHCYANHKIDDDVTQTLKKLAPHWHPVSGLDDAAAADQIARDGIDILVDLSGYTTDSRLGAFARRAAPVQATWLGYLNTTGLATMDYRVCDGYTDPSPEAEALHTERLVRLPHSQWCYDPMYDVAPVERAHPDAPDATIFGSFNQFAKISDGCLALWASVLARVPDAQLRVYGVPEGRARSRLLERLAGAGVASSRVALHGRVGIFDYFAAIADVDIALDTFPYNGATTTLDTLWMGVPLIGLRGARAVSRGTYSILSSLGAPDLIASSVEEYIEKNAELGRDVARRRELRASLRSRLRSSPLMDATSFVKDLESGYRQIWRAWCARQTGEPVPAVTRSAGANANETDDHVVIGTARVLTPDQAAIHFDLGNALRERGKLDEAAASYRQAIALRPDFSGAHINLGLVLDARGQLNEAVDSYDKAISSEPTNAIAHNNRAIALNKLGHFEAALASVRRAIDLDGRSEFKANFVSCIKNRTFVRVDDDFRRLITRAISEPWAWKSELFKVATSVIRSDPSINECVVRASRAWPRRLSDGELYGSSGLTAFANDPVLRTLLENIPTCDVDLERCLVMARRVMLERALTFDHEDPATDVLSFYCALARQCFINEYVFAYDEEEWSRAGLLREKLTVALRSETTVPPHWVAAAAAYFPLLSIPGVDTLLQQSNPDSVRALLAQQVAEPLEERRDRDTMPRLTAIGSGVSSAVRQQYEESPYPRWVKLPPPGPSASIDAYLYQRFPLAPIRPLEKKGGDIEILVAGCGTGAESIQAAQQFPSARIIAIDLSLASLCYAKRKTREIGLTSIEYAQADIMKLEITGRLFDVISSAGVLHHLRDPAAGLRRLSSLLRPGGFMHLAFYSELARRIVVEARQFIEDHKYLPTPDDIRRCRQDLIDHRAHFAPLMMSGDFYTTSECRDLLFHVQEHRFTLPRIKALLRDSEFDFIGFTVDPRIASAYATRFPTDRAQTNLDHWHQFEMEFPDTFAAMYDFWVQKSPVA